MWTTLLVLYSKSATERALQKPETPPAFIPAIFSASPSNLERCEILSTGLVTKLMSFAGHTGSRENHAPRQFAATPKITAHAPLMRMHAVQQMILFRWTRVTRALGTRLMILLCLKRQDASLGNWLSSRKIWQIWASFHSG